MSGIKRRIIETLDDILSSYKFPFSNIFNKKYSNNLSNNPNYSDNYKVQIEEDNNQNREVIPIIIPVYNTEPVVLYLTVAHLRYISKNPIIIVNDGSKEKDTLFALEEIKRKGYAIVLNKPNGGKIDALKYGLKYVEEKYNPKCALIRDDDTIIQPTVSGRTLDEILSNVCNELDEDFPVAIPPVRDIKYAKEEILRHPEPLKDTEEFQSKVIKEFGNNVKTLDKILYGENFLSYLQDIEHIIITHVIRSAVDEGVYINGTASIWKIKDLEYVLDHHTGEHWGDDLEMTILVRQQGKGIKFTDNLYSYTQLMDNWKSYIKQRMAWIAGGYRVFSRYWKDMIKNPVYFLYISSVFFSYLSLLWKLNPNIPFLSLFSMNFLLFASSYELKKTLRKNVYNKLKKIFRIYLPLVIEGISMGIGYYFFLNKNPTLSLHIQALATLSAIGYTVLYLYSIIKKYNKSVRYGRKLNILDLFMYIPYIFFYSLFVFPSGIYEYIKYYLKKQKTYKIR